MNLDLFGESSESADAPSPVAVNIESCRDLASRITDRFGMTQAEVILQRFAVSRLKDLPSDMLHPFYDFASACLHYDYPPSGSWTNGNVPTHKALVS